MLLKLINGFQVICLNCIVERVHQMRSTQLIEIEKFQVTLYHLFNTNSFIFANILNIGEKFANSISLVLVEWIDECPVLLWYGLWHICNSYPRFLLVSQSIFLLNFPIQDEYFSNCAVIFHNKINGIVLVFHASQSNWTDIKNLLG